MNDLESDCCGDEVSYSKVSGEQIIGYNCSLGNLDCVLQYKIIDTVEKAKPLQFVEPTNFSKSAVDKTKTDDL
jgi:hypothetical protein